MIVSVDVSAIFENGSPEGKLVNYARPFLSALKDIGYNIIVVSDKNGIRELKKRLQMELIPFSAVNKFPYNEETVVYFHGLIQIKPIDDEFTWIEVKGSIKDILPLDFAEFNERYIARIMNEPDFDMPEREAVVNEMSQG